MSTVRKLKIVKNCLRSSVLLFGADHLQNVMSLNCNKDLTDAIDIHLMVKYLTLLKERRLIL